MLRGRASSMKEDAQSQRRRTCILTVGGRPPSRYKSNAPLLVPLVLGVIFWPKIGLQPPFKNAPKSKTKTPNQPPSPKRTWTNQSSFFVYADGKWLIESRPMTPAEQVLAQAKWGQWLVGPSWVSLCFQSAFGFGTVEHPFGKGQHHQCDDKQSQTQREERSVMQTRFSFTKFIRQG